MSYTMIDYRQRFHSSKHNTIKLMVGLLPLAPHNDSLQYIHHVRLMQRGQNRGVTDIMRLSQQHLSINQSSVKHLNKY